MSAPDPAPALAVLSLDQAKLHVNIPLDRVENDAELIGHIAAAVERVERHLGRPLTVAPELVSASELLACKVVLAEYWRPQRARGGRSYGQASSAAAAADSGPGGLASLTARLTELLGRAASAGSTRSTPPRGTFPAAQPWPDPAGAARMGMW